MKRFAFLLLFILAINYSFAQSDEPCSATELIVGNTCSNAVIACINPPAYTNSTSASSRVTLPALTCNGFNTNSRDLWFKATVPSTGKLKITVSESGSGSQSTNFWDMALYTSSDATNCVGSVFTQIASECQSSHLPDTIITQAAGSVIFIRIWRQAVSGTSQTDQTLNRCFSICASDAPAAAPGCATIITPPNNSTKVEAPSTTFAWTSVPGAPSYVFYFGATNPPDSFDVTTDTSLIVSGLSYNETYYWSVVPKNAYGSATGCSINSFTTMSQPGPPVNNNCTAATTISSGQTITGTTVGATESRQAESCASFFGDADDDVWYTYTPTISGSASITLRPEKISFDAVMIAYSGNCNSLTTIACADASEGGNEVLKLNNLTAGITYYFRVYSFGSSGSEGAFSLTATGATLPVNLISFTGEAKQAQNILNWVTASEQNNKGFEVQRSGDGLNFHTISFIATKAANGLSNLNLYYQYIDQGPLQGNNFYRLKQVDKDKNEKTSSIVLIKQNKGTAFSIAAIYPNPVIENLSIVLNSPVSDDVTISISDITGRVLKQFSKYCNGGRNEVIFDVSGLCNGIYEIKAISKSNRISHISSFIKV